MKKFLVTPAGNDKRVKMAALRFQTLIDGGASDSEIDQAEAKLHELKDVSRTLHGQPQPQRGGLN